MNQYVRYFLNDGCLLMPDGPVGIFECVEQKDGVIKEILIGMGPQNYLTYTVDCYQLYLWYCGWEAKPLYGSLNFPEFMMEIIKEPKIKVIKNWRYKLTEKELPKETRPFLGKMFLGVRHKDKLWLAEDRYRN